VRFTTFPRRKRGSTGVDDGKTLELTRKTCYHFSLQKQEPNAQARGHLAHDLPAYTGGSCSATCARNRGKNAAKSAAKASALARSSPAARSSAGACLERRDMRQRISSTPSTCA